MFKEQPDTIPEALRARKQKTRKTGRTAGRGRGGGGWGGGETTLTVLKAPRSYPSRKTLQITAKKKVRVRVTKMGKTTQGEKGDWRDGRPQKGPHKGYPKSPK